jgi:hypothetical protein
MKVDERVRDSLYAAFIKKKKCYEDDIDHFLYKLKHASSVEEIMKAKQDLLAELTYNLPLGIGTCYFCEVYFPKCEQCEYGKIHGICAISNNGSTYNEIINKVHELISLIAKTYHTRPYDIKCLKCGSLNIISKDSPCDMYLCKDCLNTWSKE